MVDGGGVCRDKYLPVNTERLALPFRSTPSPQTTCISKRTFDGWTRENGIKGERDDGGGKERGRVGEWVVRRREPNES